MWPKEDSIELGLKNAINLIREEYALKCREADKSTVASLGREMRRKIRREKFKAIFKHVETLWMPIAR